MARLPGAWCKFQRALDQTLELKEVLDKYVERQPVRIEAHAESSDQVIRLHVTERPKAMWAVQFGEIIHNLHSALDHAVWNLIIDTGNVPREGVSGFPIFNDEMKFRPAMIEGIPEGAVTYITDIQPYQAAKRGGYDPSHDALAVLHELWNIDKHRLLHMLAGGVRGGELRVHGTVKIAEMSVKGPVFKDNAEIFRFRPHPGQTGQVNVDVNVQPHISLDESVPLWIRQNPIMTLITSVGNPVGNVLKMLSSYAVERPDLD